MDLAMRGNFPGTTAKRYLDSKASEFGASIVNSEDAGQSYYFITASILGNILDSSEPVKELPTQPVTKTARSLLAPPPPTPQEEPETESAPQPTHESAKQSLEKQLIFGSLIQSELAKRLNVYSSTVYKRRNDPEFPEWSRSKDPDGIAWSYSKKTKEFFPVEEEG
jgi:type IV secretory pathway VirB10-like protein